ncbi:MAG: polyprenyl synthetase family protein [Rhodospirillaceae bacterium]|nr:polyprenyl synthetase family protein [Rhodospirillaceae bacterium]
MLRIVGADLERVNRVVVERMQSPVALIPELAGHIIAAGGKRLRPVLTLSSARLCGYEGERHVELAACVEFIHTATLLHDDVVDESGLRRGVPTANSVWDNKASILVGDFLFSRAFEIMVADGSLNVLQTLSAASATIAEGEVHQLATTNDLSTTEEQYLEVISAKTAKLFEAAAQVGAIVADQPESAERSLAAFGAHIGMAFQLIDDVLDYSAHQATLGKAVGDDFREGKITLPVILAYRRGTPAERDFWRRTLEEQRLEDGDLERAIDLMHRHGVLTETIERARHYAKSAMRSLDGFPRTPIREALGDLVAFAVERPY